MESISTTDLTQAFGWGDDQDASRAFTLSYFDLSHFTKADVRSIRTWLHERWGVWERGTEPPWFTSGWRHALAKRSDLPRDFLPARAHARIKRDLLHQEDNVRRVRPTTEASSH